MRARAVLLTLAFVLVIALTAIFPQSWHHVKADDSGYSYPPSYGYYLSLLPLIIGGGGEVCVPVQTVEILGETEGLPDTYTFDTEVMPSDASAPLTYSWNNGDTTASSTRDLGAGEHEVKVTVCNCDNECISDDHIITIRGY